MRAILPADPLDLDEPKEGFIDESGGLQRVPAPLTSHVPTRLTPELGVDGGHELGQGGFISVAPCDEKAGKVERAFRNTGILRGLTSIPRPALPVASF